MMTEKTQWQVMNGSSERGLPPLTKSKPHVLDVKPSPLHTGSCVLELDSGSGQKFWLLRKTVLGVTLNHQYNLAGSFTWFPSPAWKCGHVLSPCLCHVLSSTSHRAFRKLS